MGDGRRCDHFSGMRWDDVHWRHGYDKWLAYGQAKTANVLFAVHLDRLGRGHGVRAFALHSGDILPPPAPYPEGGSGRERLFDEDGNPIPQDGFTTPEQGAATQVWAATSPQLAGRGGVYLDDCDIAELAPAYDEHTSIMDRTGVNEWAVDPERAARLWTLSAELTGVNAFSGFPRSRCPAAQAEDSPRRRPSTRTSTRSVYGRWALPRCPNRSSPLVTPPSGALASEAWVHGQSGENAA